MSALSLRMSEASKNRHFLHDGFPKPHRDQDRTQHSLLFGPPPSRASSPHLSTKVSPLPSPIVPSPRDRTASPTPPQVTPSTPSSSSKTSAFFGSVWAPQIPTPAPPAPVQRSQSLHPNTYRTSSKYRILVSQSPDDPPPQSQPISNTHTPSRSQTADFFNGPKASIPAPPPLIHSITSSPERAPESLPTPSPSPVKPPITPPETDSARLNIPISRFSPGRVSGDAKGRPTDDDIHLGFPDALNDPLSRLPSLHHPTTGLPKNHPSTSHAHVGFSKDSGFDGSDLSRSSSRSSVSGFRRDFYIGSSDSSAPSYQAPKPGPCEKESDRYGIGWVNRSADPAGMRTDADVAIITSPVNAEFHAGETPQEERPVGITAQPCPPRPMKPALRHFAHSGSTSAVRRETHRSSIEGVPEPGTIIGDKVPLKLLRPLGEGAFSSVWLARDVEDRLLPPLARSASKMQRQRRRKSASMAKRFEELVRGIKPSAKVRSLEGSGPGVLDEMDGKGACWPDSPKARRTSSMNSEKPSCGPGRVVAVKMMDRSLCDANDRTRISFVREVEVLRVSCCRIQSVLCQILMPFA